MDKLAVTDPFRTIRRNAIAALVLVGALVLGLGAWAVATPLAGAVIASGTVVVETSAKRVQHQQGGIVAQILVQNDDYVEAGQTLLKLDDTAIKAGLAAVDLQLVESLALEARLSAEIDGRDAVAFPAELTARLDDPQVAKTLATQTQAMKVRRELRLGSEAQLTQQIDQLTSQREGLELQKHSLTQQLAIVSAEHERMTNLLQSKLIDAGRVSDLVRQTAQLTGDIGSTTASLEQVTAMIAEKQVASRQVTTNFMSEALESLQTVREKIGQLTQQKIAATDQLRRVDLVAPQSGIVHESSINTVGGVVAPGETLMMIVPTRDRLVIDVRLNPLDLDKVSVGQQVIIRIPGLNPRTTPDLHARITQVAPDLSRDQQTGAAYFLARIVLEQGADTSLPQGEQLLPGMPAEAFIQTGERSVLTYLLEPLEEQFRRAMRES